MALVTEVKIFPGRLSLALIAKSDSLCTQPGYSATFIFLLYFS